MTEPIDPALYDINVEAELATLSTEQRKEEELDEPTEPAQSSLAFKGGHAVTFRLLYLLATIYTYSEDISFIPAASLNSSACCL